VLKEWWFYTVPICVRSKYGKSYKDIPDEKKNLTTKETFALAVQNQQKRQS